MKSASTQNRFKRRKKIIIDHFKAVAEHLLGISFIYINIETPSKWLV